MQDAIEYAAQLDTVVELLMQNYAKDFAGGDPAMERKLYDRLRHRYDNNIDFAWAMDMRAVKELAQGLPTLTRPRVTLNNLGDGLLADRQVRA